MQIPETLLNNGLNIDYLTQQTDYLVNNSGVDFCDFYFQFNTTESWALDEGLIKSGSFAINDGVGLRAICGERSFFTYSNILTQKNIRSLVTNLFVQPSGAKHLIPNSSAQNLHANLYTKSNPILSATSQTKVDILTYINDVARGKAYVTNVIASLSLEYDEIFIVRSDRGAASDIRPLIHLSISLVIEKNGKVEKASSGLGGRYLLERFDYKQLDMHIQRAYEQAILKLDAIQSPAGQLPVVLGNGWAGIILHEAIGHGLEGDFNRKQTSAFSGKIGQKVASDVVSVVDDGTLEHRRGSLNIDDEGNPSQYNVLIENGILKGYLFDELNARLMDTKSTGNGRRESFACLPMPRMTNTYMLSGTSTPKEIIASVEDGIYADSFDGGQVDITSGQFVFNSSLAWVIKAGKLAYPVKGCALVGNGPQCLKYVSMVGNDLALDNGVGMCGKNGQSVPVGVGQPTIKIDQGLVVGGAS